MHGNKNIGCGYCVHELTCSKHDPKINKAKEGCKEFKQLKQFTCGFVQPTVNIGSKDKPFYLPKD